MPCIWYKGGLCTSPALDKPTADVTLPSRCLSQGYTTCRFFKDISTSPTTSDARSSREYGRPILMIHGLNKPMKSDCKYFKLLNHESGSYLAACEVLKRYLNMYEVSLCVDYWNDCPFRKLQDEIP